MAIYTLDIQFLRVLKWLSRVSLAPESNQTSCEAIYHYHGQNQVDILRDTLAILIY